MSIINRDSAKVCGTVFRLTIIRWPSDSATLINYISARPDIENNITDAYNRSLDRFITFKTYADKSTDILIDFLYNFTKFAI